MKNNNILTKSLAAIVAVTLVGQAAYAANYSTGDLLLGFRAPSGTGSTKNVVVNLGQASTYRSISGTVDVVAGTSATETDLKAQFGNSWTDGHVVWGITGTSGISGAGGDPAKTLYATRAVPSTGGVATGHPTAWTRQSPTSQGVTTSKLGSFATGYQTYTLSSNGGAIENKADVNSYGSFQPGGTPVGNNNGISFASFNPSTESTFDGTFSAVELFRMTPGSGAGQYVGTFTLNTDGTLSFTAPAKASKVSAQFTNTPSSNSVTVQFTLPAGVASGSLKLEFVDANGTVRNLQLAGASETAGAHTITFDPTNPTANTEIVSGSLPEGKYDVSVRFTDADGHVISSQVTKGQTIVDSAAPTVGTTRLAGKIIDVNATLPDLRGFLDISDASAVTTVQTPAIGTALTALDENYSVTFTCTDAQSHVTNVTGVTVKVRDISAPVLNVASVPATGYDSITVLPDQTSLVGVADFSTFGPVTQLPAPGTLLPPGPATLTFSCQDLFNNARTATKSITVGDKTPPVVNAAGVSTTGYSSTTPLGDLRSQLVITDFSNPVTTTQNPPVGYFPAVGQTLTFTSTDAANNTTVTNIPLTVTAGTLQTTLLISAAATTGDAVPGAGTTAGIAANSKFTSFGAPAINDAGQVAFLASWSSPAVAANGAQPAIAAKTGKGIFAGPANSPTLVAYVGGPCTITGAVIGTVFDPVINESGKVAFLATLINLGTTTATTTPVSTANDLVVLTNAFTGGALTIAAREASSPALSDFAIISVISNISLQGSNLLYTATLKTGTGAAVTAVNDKAAFMNSNGTLTKVIREGEDSLPGLAGLSPVASFTLLTPVTGSPAQTRGHAGNAVTLQAKLVDGSVSLLDSVAGTLTPFKKTGATVGGVSSIAAATFNSFGASVAADGADEVVNATLNPSGLFVTAANNIGIFKGQGSLLQPIARLGDSIGGGVMNAFGEPLVANGSVAYPGSFKIGTVANAGIFWKTATGSVSKLTSVVDEVPGAPNIANRFKAFTSLALSDNGPIIYAQLKTDAFGISATNDYGIWAVDSQGRLTKLVQEGDVVSGKTVVSLTFLNAVTGSNGVTRNFNNNRQVIYSAKFIDAGIPSTGIITQTIP